MKLRNKKTGEIVDGVFIDTDFMSADDLYSHRNNDTRYYHSISELTDEWEDYEEPKAKGYWYIRDGGDIDFMPKIGSITERHKEIGNYFETREEAEKAVEKLKACKRLKDKGFKFGGLEKELRDVRFDIAPAYIKFNKGGDFKWFIENKDDLYLLFGGNGYGND